MIIIIMIIMALTQIDFDEKEEEIIETISKENKLNKPKTVRKIVRDRGEIDGNIR